MYTSYPGWAVLKKEGMILFSRLTLVLLAPQNSLENRVWGFTSEAYFFTVAESPLGMENGDAKGQATEFLSRCCSARLISY